MNLELAKCLLSAFSFSIVNLMWKVLEYYHKRRHILVPCSGVFVNDLNGTLKSIVAGIVFNKNLFREHVI